MRSKKPFSAGEPTFVIFLTLLLASVAVPAQAQAQTFKVLHTFKGSDGVNPVGQLVRDAAGNIFGTTGEGGSGKCQNVGCGTVFKMNKAGKEVWLYSFKGAGGEAPVAGLLRDSAGNLYGTTGYGGVNTKACSDNFPHICGVVFKLDPTGKKETVLHKFTNNPDGDVPESLLIEDSAGNLYGTTLWGGTSGYGSVFKTSANHSETILHSFAGPPDGGGDGAYVYTGVIRDSAGNLYGVTDAGGEYGGGTVFKLDSAGEETLLYSFACGADGCGPDSVLLADDAGNLYGTTEEGGNDQCGGYGCGVVFELSPHSDGSWTESVLYAFCSLSNCADGSLPWKGPLVRDANGNLYGTTMWGGTSRCNG